MLAKKTAFLWIAAALIAAGGCGGGSGSPSTTLATTRGLTLISPTSAVAGSPDVTLTVIGSGFTGQLHDQSLVVWSANGTNTGLATTFVSGTELSAIVPAALLQVAVTAQVFVETGDPMGDVPLRTTNSLNFVVTPPGAAVISAISPTSATAGSPDLTLNVRGSNFVPFAHFVESFVVWSAKGTDTALATTFVNSTELTAVVPAALLQYPGTAQVSIETGDIMGFSDGVIYPKSNSFSFTISP